jgi:hypothetical protein
LHTEKTYIEQKSELHVSLEAKWQVYLGKENFCSTSADVSMHNKRVHVVLSNVTCPETKSYSFYSMDVIKWNKGRNRNLR